MNNFFNTRMFGAPEDMASDCTLIDRIAALAQTSHDLNTTLRCAADEIGRTLGLERAAILLRHESAMRRTGDYFAHGIGPVEKEKLRQLDLEITRDLGSHFAMFELANVKSDPRLSRLLKSPANGRHPLSIKSILVVPLVIDSQTAGALILYHGDRRRSSTQVKHVA